MSIPKLKSLIEQPVKKISKIAGVVLKSEGEVLLTKRSEVAGKYPNFWAVPMGHVEENASFKAGAAREFKEDTMLDIDSNSLVYLSMLKDSNYNRVVGLYMIELPNKPEPTLDEEHSEWGYYDVKSLPTPMEKNLRIALELKT